MEGKISLWSGGRRGGVLYSVYFICLFTVPLQMTSHAVPYFNLSGNNKVLLRDIAMYYVARYIKLQFRRRNKYEKYFVKGKSIPDNKFISVHIDMLL